MDMTWKVEGLLGLINSQAVSNPSWVRFQASSLRLQDFGVQGFKVWGSRPRLQGTLDA